MRKYVAVITGGDSSEEVISVKSARLIMDSIDPQKYIPVLVYIQGSNWSVREYEGKAEIPIDKNDFSFQTDNSKIKFNCAYLIIHGPPAENGKLQAYFDMLHIPYIGPRVLQASLTFNKEVCKQYLGLIGIQSSRALLFGKKDTPDFQKISTEIGFPCFVKPNEGGSSFGVTKVYQKDQLENALKKALSEDNTVLVEKFLPGVEVTCGVFAQNGDIHVLPVTEIVSTKDFFDFEAKYTPGASEEITPARISPELSQKCQELTIKIYKFLELSGFSRVDYIIRDNEPFLLEVNTIPGMTPESIVPKQLKTAGYNVKSVITEMINEALSS